MSEAETDTTELTAHEFRAELPCEHSRHGSHHPGNLPAMWVMHAICPACALVSAVFMCEPGRVWILGPGPITCAVCAHTAAVDSWSLTFEPIPEATP